MSIEHRSSPRPSRRQSRFHPACLVLASALAAGCGGLEGELLEGLQAEEHRTLRVQPSMLGVDAFELENGKRYLAKAGDFSFMGSGSAVHALEALKEEGYASEEATSLPQGFGNSIDAFEITKKGAEFFKPDAFGVGIDVCIGEKTATEIVEYTEPADNGPQMIQASFRYEIALNDLADDLGIEDALEAEVQRAWPGEGVATYTKTNKGWRLEHALWQ
jgi:hypothetical protein